MSDPQYWNTYQIKLPPDTTFDDIVTIINELNIRYQCSPEDEQYKKLEKYSIKV